MKLLKPAALHKGDTIGIFTPSFPAHVMFREKYQHGLSELERIGYRIVEGDLTKKAIAQGYRSGSPQDRAEEFMKLIVNPDVKCLMATIGGFNSSSMIPYLDFDLIRKNLKIIIGYSDVTALHMAIMTQSAISTFYGPALVPSFGEWPCVLPETLEWFEKATGANMKNSYPQKLMPPEKWSNHFRNAMTNEWKTPAREYHKHEGWITLVEGEATAPLVIANLNTLSSLAGTQYFPKLKGCILLLEEQEAPAALEERRFRQMQLMGVFDDICGLIIGRPEVLDFKNSIFDYNQLILEIVGHRNYPIITNFDCSHTHPMMTLAEGISITISANEKESNHISVIINEPMIQF